MKPTRAHVDTDRAPTKRHRCERSPEPTRRTSHHKKLDPLKLAHLPSGFMVWPKSFTKDSTICFVFWADSSTRAHMSMQVSNVVVTNDEEILCKAFPNTFLDKELTWFTSLKSGTIDSWHTLEKIFLDKFSTVDTIPKTRGDLTNIK